MINFDELIDRRKTNSIKWTKAFGEKTLKENQIPMWVADMDFKAAPEIIEAIKKEADFGIFGYFTYDEYYESVIKWHKERYNWDIKKEWLNFTQGLVQGFNIAISALTRPGESVLVLTPTYYPMFAGIKNQGCQIVESYLIYDDNTCRYTIDYEDVAKKVKDNNLTAALIGNPHNPTGRLYSVEELSKLADILIENNVKIICDDIHCDIIVDPTKKYTPLASIEKYSNHIISMNAPSKTFNLAGAKVSNVIIQNEEIMRAFKFQMERFCVSVSILSLAACKTAYSKCAYWVDEMRKYVWGNYNYIKNYIENSILKDYIKAVPLEGSYLMFADNKNLMKEFNMNQEDLNNFYYDSCNLSLDEGNAFGKAGIGFMRFNLATQRYYVENAMNNISEAVKKLKK
ncbi:PatB family C-S lyase [Brachyspira intermedia]|uniref:MalY/PatB family protein n=1 Tax=Brachyspira intermedia TaxID=84377 RepID=UPI00300587F0